MAEDAFAISPISARASLPSEADYGAIRDAFMETARGRWFLDEYARRNRNADTGMVLDAVARIEASVARGPASSSPASTIAMIRPLIDDARLASEAAMTSADGEEIIAAGRRASRIIREISWSLRETGTDPRICNIFDAQLLAIEKVNDLASDDTPRALIGEAFDDLILKLEEIGSGAPLAPRETNATKPEPIETVGANLEMSETASAEPEQVVATPAVDRPSDVLAVAPTSFEQTPLEQTPLEQSPLEQDQTEHIPNDDDRAADDALLDMVAMEMSAPDLDDVDDFESDDEALADMQSLADSAPAPMMATPAKATPAMVASAIAAPVMIETPAAPPSLGAALIANGIVRTRATSAALAPFHRMSQIEKIAFFS